MARKPSDTVTVYPAADGIFIDGVPAVVQDVPEADAEWMCAHGAFTRELPAGCAVDDEGRVVRAPVIQPA